MTEAQVTEFLRYPAAEIVDFALTLVNLTWQERTAITLCGRQHYTQEAAAEMEGYSVDSMQRWYRSGIKKVMAAWEGHGWITKILSA